MTKKMPNKDECLYIYEMLDAGLINFTYIHPWADKLIGATEALPSWLCDLSTKKYQGDLIKALGEYVFSEPFEPVPADIEKFHVACLYLRYERHELSWATFLSETGKYLDGVNGGLDCETPYHYLNIVQDFNFSLDAEEQTKKQYLEDHELEPWIKLAKEKYKPFLDLKM
ncbi:MAG: hypothetical protein HND56_01770 [Pseudomonadota bacterium]|nr:hypothetical protein [Pseudomonadota bacterium]QKK04489.1 MAG: hypothetical protein HND56_01770 [Pseudomonadota bacterium]